MKLYATIQTDRATKAQGGNKYLFIMLQAGNKERRHFARIDFRENEYQENGYILRVYELDTETGRETGKVLYSLQKNFFWEAKAKRRKGEYIHCKL